LYKCSPFLGLSRKPPAAIFLATLSHFFLERRFSFRYQSGAQRPVDPPRIFISMDPDPFLQSSLTSPPLSRSVKLVSRSFSSNPKAKPTCVSPLL